MPHKQIAECLYEKHGLSGWWSQMVTVVYEQERGLREKHQKSDGSYVICVSKVLPVSINTLFEFWSDGDRRNQWLTHKNYSTVTITISKTTLNKSMHIVWNEIKKITTNNSRISKDKKLLLLMKHTKAIQSLTERSISSSYISLLSSIFKIALFFFSSSLITTVFLLSEILIILSSVFLIDMSFFINSSPTSFCK
jgi:uncharacterized protein YndB with AHSA1/START domain